MSLHRLRSFDIKERDEEELVQEIINLKVAANPPEMPIVTSDVPDIKTPEQEAEWQAKLDARRKKAIPSAVELPNGNALKEIEDIVDQFGSMEPATIVDGPVQLTPDIEQKSNPKTTRKKK